MMSNYIKSNPSKPPFDCSDIVVENAVVAIVVYVTPGHVLFPYSVT